MFGPRRPAHFHGQLNPQQCRSATSVPLNVNLTLGRRQFPHQGFLFFPLLFLLRSSFPASGGCLAAANSLTSSDWKCVGTTTQRLPERGRTFIYVCAAASVTCRWCWVAMETLTEANPLTVPGVPMLGGGKGGECSYLFPFIRFHCVHFPF